MKTYLYKYPDGNEIKVTEDTVNITPLTFLRNGTIYEPESVEYFFTIVNMKDISGSKNIVDIGAQSGLYSLYGKYLKKCNIYAFEANPETYALLVDNIKLNEITNVYPQNKGLGEKEAQLTLRVPLTGEEKGLCSFGSNPLRFSKWEEKLVYVTSLDNEFYEKNIPVHYIKCDTEGWEVNILKGGVKTLNKWSPEIVLEVCDTNLHQCGTNKKELIDFLEGLGYRLIRINNDENWHYSKKPN